MHDLMDPALQAARTPRLLKSAAAARLPRVEAPGLARVHRTRGRTGSLAPVPLSARGQPADFDRRLELENAEIAAPREAGDGVAVSVIEACLRSRALSPISLNEDVSGLVRTGEAEALMDQDLHHTDRFGKVNLAVRGPFGQPDHCRRAAEKHTGSRRIKWKRQLPGHVRGREEILQIRFSDIVGPCRVDVLRFARRQSNVSIVRETSLKHPVHFQIREVGTTTHQVTTATFPG